MWPRPRAERAIQIQTEARGLNTPTQQNTMERDCSSSIYFILEPDRYGFLGADADADINSKRADL